MVHSVYCFDVQTFYENAAIRLLSNPYNIHVPDATFVHAAAARGSASHGRCTFCRRAIVWW